MFGFGSRRRVRNETFGPSRLRNALLAGAGMLAWRWWKNRQAARQNNPGPIGRDPRQSYDTGQSNQGGGSF